MSSYPIPRKIAQIVLALVLAVSLTSLSPSFSLAEEPNDNVTNSTISESLASDTASADATNDSTEDTDVSSTTSAQLTTTSSLEDTSTENSGGSPVVQADNDSISIIFTNDVHCAIDANHDEDETPCLGYAGVGAVVEAAEAKYDADNVTLVDAGDAVQGGPVGTLTEGEAIVDIMNAMGYDYAVPGNHEFDYGMDQFNELVNKSDAKYLSCNFVDASGNTVLAPYAIQTYKDVSDGAQGNSDGVLKVAFVGITTPESLTKSSPVNFQDANGNYIYGFCQDSSGEALYRAVQNSVNEATDEGADYVIAIGHLGNASITQRWSSEAVIANTTGIDAFIDGHSHEEYSRTAPNKDGEKVPLAQTGTKLANVGELTITPSAENDISIGLTSAATYSNTSSAIQSVVDGVNARLNEIAMQVVGTSDVDLLSEDEATGLYARWQETNLGDFVADAYRLTLGADVGLVNGGGIRASISKGDVTYYDLLSVQPFGNELCVVEVTGQQLKDALEMGVRELPDSSGGFLQVSGLTFKVNTSIPSSVKVDELENFLSVDGQYRVYDVKVNGQPLDLNHTYTVASHDYMLLEGGSGMTMFADASILQERVMIDNQSIIEYMNQLGGVIGDAYANPEGAGRITFTDGFITEPSPEPETPTDQVSDQIADNPSGPAAEQNDSLPQTSDSTPIVPMACVAGAAFATVIGAAWRMKQLRSYKQK